MEDHTRGVREHGRTDSQGSRTVSKTVHHLSAAESALQTAQDAIENQSTTAANEALEKARLNLKMATDDPADLPSELSERYTAVNQQITSIADTFETARENESESATNTESPTRAELLYELYRLTNEIERVPLTPEMRERGSYGPHQYYDEFGGWNEALLAAGIDKEAALIRDIQRVAEEAKDQPTTTDMEHHGRYSSGVHTTYFESWDDALRAAGITDTSEPDSTPSQDQSTDDKSDADETTGGSVETTKKNYIDELTRLQEESQLYVRAQDMNTDGAYSASEIIDTFGSWDEALSAADIDKGAILSTELQRVASKLGHPPTQSEMHSHGRCSPSPYVSYFGSWSAAKEQCLSDIELETDSDEDQLSRVAMIEELQALNDKVEGVFKAATFRQEGSFSVQEIRAEFGSWENALEAAGIDRKEQLIDEIQRVADKVGERPSRAAFDARAQISSSTVAKYFESFATALDDVLDTTPASRLESNDATPQQSSTPQPTVSTTIADVSTEGRLEEPILVKVIASDESPGPRKQAELQVQDVADTKVALQIWEVHDVEVDWDPGHWYELEEARLKLWTTDSGEAMKRLSSTKDLAVRQLGEQIELGDEEPDGQSRPNDASHDQGDQSSQSADDTSATTTESDQASDSQRVSGDTAETSDELQDEIDELLSEFDV
ncbi:homing endonuclease associated repeat-containing protein [Halorhabdus tiamatea]|nr:hypothetical protein [Halorhabdus tiamatea]